MKKVLGKLRSQLATEWRGQEQICSQWRDAQQTDSRLLESRTTKGWWQLLERLGITLLITRENEHLVIAASARGGAPRSSYLPVPHPSGLVVDRDRGCVWLASTRNPNQVFQLKPVVGLLERDDLRPRANRKMIEARPLVPVASSLYPGSLYLHDLALIGGNLYGNAVGHNAIVTLAAEGRFERVWWPLCIVRNNIPDYTRNYIQLNSIAAGDRLRDSFFTASSASIGRLRPGHLRYAVDGRGVVFSGLTREVICGGLTRPHSARLASDRLWVANSGYGEMGVVSHGRFESVARLPGWTRGLAIHEEMAFVATSRIIDQYAHYAPGLDPARSRCAIHAVSLATGKVLETMEWPAGNQIFAIDWMSDRDTTGFCFEFPSHNKNENGARGFFYSCLTN